VKAATGVDPIFIGGLAYSGKTPLRIALGLHPDLSMTRKTHLWDRFSGRFGDLRDPANLERCLAALLADPDVQRLEPDAEALRTAFAQTPRTEAWLFGLVHAQHAERAGKRRWGEQLGPIERFADPVFEAFAAARMIHMVRDPRDRYAASPHRGPASARTQTASWRRSAALAERNLDAYPDRYLVLRYEALVADPAGTLEEVMSFIGETSTPEMRAAITRVQQDEGESERRPVSPAARMFIERSTASAVRRLDDAARAGSPAARTEGVR